MTRREPKDVDSVAFLANRVDHDLTFPKQSENNHEISRYLEEQTDYLPTMTIFDEAWEAYLADE